MLEPESKSMSLLAISALVIAAIGSGSFLFAPLVSVSVASTVLAAIAMRSMRKYEQSGRSFAFIATAIGLTSIVLSPLWHLHLYQSESLPNHQRIDLSAAIKEHKLDQYDGKAVCVKGYSLYSAGEPEIEQFLLSPDSNYRKPEFAVSVVVRNMWKMQTGPIAVSGVLRVNYQASEPFRRYTLEAAKVVDAKTSELLAPRLPGDC